MRLLSFWLFVAILLTSFSSNVISANPSSTNMTPAYRVFQNSSWIGEFSDLSKAITVAKKTSQTYVEDSRTRKWLWNNYPRYQVYERGIALPNGSFQLIQDAKSLAMKNNYRSVRDLRSNGWVWDNYPNFRVYVGENSNLSWEFATKDEAVEVAKKWSRASIVDMSTQSWVWDNFSSLDKSNLCKDNMNFRVYQGTQSVAEWQYPCLKNALVELVNLPESHVVNLTLNETVYEYRQDYRVYRYNNLIKKTHTAKEAIAYAKSFANSEIRYNNQVIWENQAYYQVYQGNNLIAQWYDPIQAVNYAIQYSNSSVVTSDQQLIWQFEKSLQVWGWTLPLKTSNVQALTASKTGLDIISPVAFGLLDKQGSVGKYINQPVIQYLKQQGYTVYPLVNNKFDTEVTSAFLRNPEAQQKFISTLISHLTALDLTGFNIDFEFVDDADRDLFTAFIQALTSEAKKKNLVVSIDLPRGNFKTNDKRAYDQKKLGKIVDYVNIMTYSQQFSGRIPAGGVHTMAWVEQGIKDYLAYDIPRSKLIMSVPLFVREWKLDSTGKIQDVKALAFQDIDRHIKEKKAQQIWDASANQYKVTYSEDGYTYVFWLENQETTKARIDIAKKYHLAGIAIWRLGYENQATWQAIVDNK